MMLARLIEGQIVIDVCCECGAILRQRRSAVVQEKKNKKTRKKTRAPSYRRVVRRLWSVIASRWG